MATITQKIVTCLWFNDKAEEAANFYVSLFKNSKINAISHYSEAGKEIHGQKPGSVLTVEFELEGQKFTLLNGGPIFKLSEAVSFQVFCEDQKEVDSFWNKLTADGGEESQCGWLKDKYGHSWQIIPKEMPDLLNSSDKEKSERAMMAMMKMRKIDIAAIKKAYDGK